MFDIVFVFRIGIVFLIFQFCISTAFDELEDKSGRNPEENSCVEVRAVFINCEPVRVTVFFTSFGQVTCTYIYFLRQSIRISNLRRY